ncbi:hypothetical protein ACFFU9_12825 [Mariniflexile ostreae]|uniref:Antitoxin component YwqK of YwqJK toxin-antitoxin module n=1 Tax=Mariniflexile ostreae TaxID=1520892 RepID=A0ABV5FDV4_9FLAO
MANRLLIFTTFLLFQISYSQEINIYDENYKFLSKIEYEKVLNISDGKLLDGNYYVVDSKKNISIKRFIKGIKTGEWLSFHSLFNGLKLVSTVNYSNGKLQGYFYRTDNHTYNEEGYYKDGEKHGVWTKKTYSDMNIVEIITYKKGKKDGKYSLEEIIEGKTKTIKGKYKHNKKCGLWVIKDEYLTIIKEDGSEEPSIKKEYYRNGILIKK